MTLKIYDAKEMKVTEPVNNNLKQGLYEVEFKAENLPSDVYFYNLSSEGFTETKRMMLIK